MIIRLKANGYEFERVDKSSCVYSIKYYEIKVNTSLAVS